MTRTPATDVMKLVSPDQRGSDMEVQVGGDAGTGGPPRLAPMFSPSGS